MKTLWLCVSILACYMAVVAEEADNPVKTEDQKEKSEPARIYPKPTFEPMAFERYKTAYPNIPGLACGLEKQFDTFMHVYGVTFAAMPNTPVPELIHAGKVLAQLMDSDQDFVPDDPKIYDFHLRDQDGKRVIVILVDNKAFDNKFSQDKRAERVWMNQALRPGHSGVGHSRDGEFDVSVEELFHRVGNAYQQIYWDDFGTPEEEEPQRSSALSRALDKARGMDRTVTPAGGKWIYPKGAWYTYGAVGCEWECQIGEYFWMAWSTNVGYHELLTRARDVPKEEGKPGGWAENCSDEWKPANRAEFKKIDKALYALLNERGYNLPTTIPFGEYGGNRVKYHGYEVEVRRDGAKNRFFINRKQHPDFTFKRGNTYYFDQSLKSNAGHAFKFSAARKRTRRGKLEYTNGVTTRGRPGSRGSYTKITVAADAPDKLYYYCASHPGMTGESVITIVNSSKN